MAKSLGALLDKRSRTWADDDSKKKNSNVDVLQKFKGDKGEKSEKEIKGEKEIKEERDNRNEKVDRAEREIKDEKASSRGTDRMRDMTDSKVNHPYQLYPSMKTMCNCFISSSVFDVVICTGLS